METASIQPSRDDDVARVPASIFVFPPDRFLDAACHGARRDVNGPRDPCGGPARPIDAPTRTEAKSGRHQPERKTKMNTKTLDNTANDPWADIAHSDLVNYVRNTGHFPADGYQTPKPQTGIDPWAPTK